MKESIFLRIFLTFLVLALLWNSAGMSHASSHGQLEHCAGGPLVETTLPWPLDLHRAVSDALCNRSSDILPGDYARLILTSLDFWGDGSWATATVVMRPQDVPTAYESLLLFPSLMAVMYRDGPGWQVAFEGTDDFRQLISQAPALVLSGEAKAVLLREGIALQGIPGWLNLKWPWKDGQSWVYTQGPHKWYDEPVNSSLDFAPPWTIPVQDREVRAAASGTVVRKCEDSIQTDVILFHTSGYATGYLHTERNSASHLTIGRTVSQGDRMGITYNGHNWKDTCGRGTGPHLHFYVGRWSGNSFSFDSIAGTVISGWTLGSNGCFTKFGQQPVCVGASIRSDNTPATVISIGQTVNGEINPAGEQDRYYFDGSSGQEVMIEMTKSSGTLDPYIILYRPNGSFFAYDDDSAGYPNARLVRQLPDNGRYMLVAKAYFASQTGAYTLRITAGSGGRDTDDGRWLVHNQWLNGQIDPTSDEDWYYFYGITGRIVSIRMNRTGGNLDSYLELYAPNGSRIAADDDGGGWDTRNAWLVTILPSTGIYRVKARSYIYTSSGPYTIRLRRVDANNYALNRPACASSVESSRYVPLQVFDGRLDTRWSSRSCNPQWIYVDLGQNRTFDAVILRWEAAYAKRYGIYVSDGNYWQQLFWTDNGRGGTEIIRFPATTARWVGMYGVQCGTPWGYSLWEFEVYNSNEATAPTVPPPDPEKEPDAVEPLPPLPLPEEEAGKEVLALYIGNGEDAQEVEATSDTGPDELFPVPTGQEGLPVAVIEFVLPGYPGGGVVVYPDETLEFIGSAADNDAEGDPSIVAYEWQSDRDGLLSTQQNFTRTASTLSWGEHVISFRAQDNEGNWSEWDQVTIQVQPYYVYLPLALRDQ